MSDAEPQTPPTDTNSSTSTSIGTPDDDQKFVGEEKKEDEEKKKEEGQQDREVKQQENKNNTSPCLKVPQGTVAYTGNVQQLVDRHDVTKDRVTQAYYAAPQIVVQDQSLWPHQPINQGIVVPTYLGDPAELAKIQPPAVVQTLAERVAELSEEEKEGMKQLRAHCDEKGYTVAAVSDWMLIRYLIARQFKVKKSIEMLDASMGWRAGLSYDELHCKRCRIEPNGHCMLFAGWDMKHRPVMYMSHKWALSRDSVDESMAHVVENYNHLETKMSEGVTQWVAMVDFVSYTHWRDGSPTMGKKVGGLLQNHYPERLALQVLVDPPTSFWLLWKVIGPFVDEKTKSKVVFWYTKQEPNIATEFPKIFPPHLCDYLLSTFLSNAVKEKRKKQVDGGPPKCLEK